MTHSAEYACLLPSDLGPIGLVWTDRGLRRLLLPERDPAAMERRLSKRAPDASRRDALPRLAEQIRAYASGEPTDFTAVDLDLGGIDAFRLAIYAAARQLAYGETTTYGALAATAGYDGLARETGQAMGANPVPIVIPCHRVVAAGGKIGGFSAPGGSATKARMLAMEGARLAPDPRQASFGF